MVGYVIRYCLHWCKRLFPKRMLVLILFDVIRVFIDIGPVNDAAMTAFVFSLE